MAYGDDPEDDPMPTPRDLADHKAKAAESLKVPCRHCGARPGQPCVNKVTGLKLKKFGAHTMRIFDATNVIVLPTPLTNPEEDELF